MNVKGFFVRKSEEDMTAISWRRIWIAVVAIVIVCGVLATSVVVYANSYSDRVFPGVTLGNVHVGGMNEDELRSYIRNMHNKLLDTPIPVEFVVEGETHNFDIYASRVAEDNVYESISIDVDVEVDELINYRKSDNIVASALSALWIRISQPRVQLARVQIEKNSLSEQIDEYVAEYIEESRDAGFDITSINPLSYTITTSTVGQSFDYERVFGGVVQSWSNFEFPTIRITTMTDEPSVVAADVEMVTSSLAAVLDPGNIYFLYTDPTTKRPYRWYITTQDIADWLIVVKDEENGDVWLSLSREGIESFVGGDIADFITVEPQDAKFQIGNNKKVTLFQGARPGIEVDVDATLAGVQRIIDARVAGSEEDEEPVEIITKETPPDISTEEVNDLGIKEILGYGHSKFVGSPGNRVKNISNAAHNILHGRLIAPDEEFSLVQALEPFDYANGYLPELVIKGDRIIPEMGGGLCQVGSTMFRAAMNSGLPITERRNHSLVVDYYNDLTNGLPGTDATIYGPHPDFRFVNDTGHHILITAEVNYKTADLYFYFWGTSDGREGFYAPPKVSRWIPTGPEKIIESNELAPGERECQAAHIGAEASFVYTRILPDGEKIDRVFNSYYRPLPRICLVGVDKSVESSCPEGETCDVIDSEDTTEIVPEESAESASEEL